MILTLFYTLYNFLLRLFRSFQIYHQHYFSYIIYCVQHLIKINQCNSLVQVSFCLDYYISAR